MILYKKDIKRIDKRILNKALEIIANIHKIKKKSLNIDKDIISIKVNSQYRLVYRESTKMICRLLTHNDYNKIIRYNNINNIK